MFLEAFDYHQGILFERRIRSLGKKVVTYLTVTAVLTTAPHLPHAATKSSWQQLPQGLRLPPIYNDTCLQTGAEGKTVSDPVPPRTAERKQVMLLIQTFHNNLQ